MPPPGATRSAREHEFAHELELARRKAGLTTAQLAEALYCAARTVRRYQNAERRPPRGLVVRWETICGVRPGGLTDRYDRLDLSDAELRRASESRARAVSPAGRVLFNVPAVVASFTGRDDLLAALDDALRRGDRAVVTHAITGLGGVGKTQLAARYVQLRAERYELVAWIRAEEGGVEDLAALAVKLGAPVEGLSPHDRAQVALDRLAANAGPGLWMLVLDNVQSPADLDRLLPRAGAGHVLVTSRDRALREFGHLVAVDVFDEDTATAFLVDRAGRRGDERGARALARALGGLPLALSHAAAYCESSTSFGGYLGLLDALPAHALFDSHPEVSYPQTVASTWKASIAAASSHASLAPRILAIAACLGPEAIPKALFSGLVDTARAPERKRLADAFNAVARFSLAAVDDDTLSVHRLLQRTIREQTRGDGAAVDALGALRAAFPDDARTPESWAVAERLLPHCLALAGCLAGSEHAGSLVELLNRASWYLNNAEPGSRRSVAIACANERTARARLGPDHPERLMARNHLATALQWAGRLDEAIAVFESVFEDRTRVLGAEHDHTLVSASNLALAYEDAGRSAEAIAIYERLLPVQERILGVDHARCSFTRHNLAVSYKAAGRLEDAIAILEPLLAAREAALGGENPETLKTRHHLAASYREAGRAAEAVGILEQLHPTRARVVGAEHPHTLMTRHELGRAYSDAGRCDDAIALLRELVAVCERLLGAAHPDTLTARDSLGEAYARAGRVAAAAATLQAVLAERERILGAAHRDTRRTRAALAAARERAGGPPA